MGKKERLKEKAKELIYCRPEDWLNNPVTRMDELMDVVEVIHSFGSRSHILHTWEKCLDEKGQPLLPPVTMVAWVSYGEEAGFLASTIHEERNLKSLVEKKAEVICLKELKKKKKNKKSKSKNKKKQLKYE